MKFKKSKNGQDSIKINLIKRPFSLVLTMALVASLSSNAQSTPEPPEPPTVSKTTSSKSYSVTVENDDNQSHNSSISVSVSEDTYKFRASYHKSKNEGVKTILLDHLGKDQLKINGNTYLWTDNNDDVFECKLTKGHLKIYVDTEVASKDFTAKIKTMGDQLKQYISGSNDKARSLAEAKRRLERAERELVKAKREAERAAKEAKHATKN